MITKKKCLNRKVFLILSTVLLVSSSMVGLILFLRYETESTITAAQKMIGKSLDQVKKSFTPIKELSEEDYQGWKENARLRDSLPRRKGTAVYIYLNGVDVVFFFFEQDLCIDVFHTQT